MKYSKIISALFIGLTVTACNYETQVSLYASDLTEDTGEKPIYAPVMLTGEGTFSQNDCGKIRNKVEPSLQNYFENVEFKGCSDGSNLDNKISFSASAPVHVGSVQNGISSTRFDLPFGIVVAYDQELPNSRFILISRGNNYKPFAEALDNAMTGSNLLQNGAKVTLEIQNDTREEISFTSDGVFVNGAAIGRTDPKTFSLQRRDSIQIKLSDVSQQHIKEKGWEQIGRVDFKE
ncbi:DUF7424 family protein [Pseudovibrio ascidiaceicola]|uniref:DUF7424 family protein n=1 Tax=Pseudovibrio ascidiaceicola TaxID=285279 RepID=UPI000D694649|nr:hypothetical protein [Pseudovibrio ascidiaceicola]